MTASEQIQHDLEKVAQDNETIELLNLYKELPIVSKAVLDQAGADSLTFKTHRRQLTCLELEKRTILLNDTMQVAVSAEVAALDKNAGTVTLTHFVPVSQQVGDRTTVRVEPKQPYPVEVTVEGQAHRATLADISLNGVGLRVPGPDLPFKKKMAVSLSFQLPGARIEAPGVVRYTKPEADHYRVGVDFSQNAQVTTLIVDYIRERRDEILAELDAR